jgi:hypothetical protein
MNLWKLWIAWNCWHRVDGSYCLWRWSRAGMP